MLTERAARITAAAFALLSCGAAAHGEGALAIGACGAYGQAYDYRTEAHARANALAQCAGSGCRVVTTMRSGCAAFSIDANAPCGAFGYAVADRLGRAENDALKQCYKYGGRTCVIRAWACDGRS